MGKIEHQCFPCYLKLSELDASPLVLLEFVLKMYLVLDNCFVSIFVA